MTRELDLIDVWFDSVLCHMLLNYIILLKIKKNLKLTFQQILLEGVDQTRGWFFTLHAISTILFDNISFKNVISNGLVLDKDGIKCLNDLEML